MDNILKKLYNGELYPYIKCKKNMETLKNSRKKAFLAYDTFQSKLPENMKEEFTRLIKLHMDLLPLEMEQNFIDGFVTGTRLITEIYSDNGNEKTTSENTEIFSS